MGGIPQGVSEAGLPPTELLLPTGQLQQVTLLQVGPILCWGCHGAQPWEGRQDFSPGQAREGERRYSCDPREMKGEEGRVGEERGSENETPNILKMPSKLSMAI